MSKPIRVLIVDDSALMRRVIAAMLEQDPTIQVVGMAADGREAIKLVQELHPDVVTMDVRMPVMDGLATTEHLMAYHPTPILVLTASLATYEVDITFQMLGAGALEVIEKPAGTDSKSLERAARDLIRRIKVLSRVKVVTHLRGRRRGGTPELPTRPVNQPPDQEPQLVTRVTRVEKQSEIIPARFPLVVIGASTGGPRIVYRILSELPPDLPAAVLVVQHIAEGFSNGMAEWLSNASHLPVHLAVEGQPLRPREVLVAPDRRDMLIRPDCSIHMSDNQLLIQRPAIDITMQAAAEVFGSYAVGVLLTGMGRDGAQGMLAIRRRQGYTIAQDEATSAIFGMPRAAIQLDAAIDVLPASQIAERIIRVVTDLHIAGPAGRRNTI